MQEAIAQVSDGNDLSQSDAAAVMTLLMKGEATQAQIGAFLVALRMKGETIDEIAGFATTMRDLATPIKTERSPLVDTCGTGGDHSGSFNISTAAAFVVAGTGLAVAKHGNRSATSKCGSADVLETLGVNIDASPEVVGRCIDDVGIGFLFARSLHAAMKHVAQPRMELKIRTVFNLLGPLTNPARACGQVIGVYDANRTKDLARVLGNMGSRRAFVVAGSDGLDEITLDGATMVSELNEGSVSDYEIRPETIGLKTAPRDSIMGGDAEMNASILRGVLDGDTGPRRDIVLANAAAAILAGGDKTDWKEAAAKAAESIDSGAARGKLEALVKASNAS